LPEGWSKKMPIEFPIDFSEALIIIITGVIVALVMRRSYTGAFGSLIEKIYAAADGDLDTRLDIHRPDAIGELGEAVDRLLSRRAQDIYELRGINEELVRRYEDVETVAAEGLRVVSSLKLEDVLANTVRIGMSLVGAKAGVVYLYDPRSGALVSGFHDGFDFPDGGLSVKPKQGFAGWAFQRRKTLMSNNVDYDEITDHETLGQLDIPVRSALAAPIKRKGVVIGALELFNKPESFSGIDGERIEMFLEYVSVGIANANAAAAPRNS